MLCVTFALITGLQSALAAQDTTQVYPWRLSYFPYVTASPNDGVMAMGRIVFFRQSRWNDRVSLADEVAVEGGYSTKDAWLLRARGDFPRLAPGWRLQVVAQADREVEYEVGIPANRQFVNAEVTRVLQGPVALALQGRVTHLTLDSDSSTSTTDWIARLALIVDRRDREYDTRRGYLIQMGVFVGSATNARGGYGLASGWVPLDDKTRVTARAGLQVFQRQAGEDERNMPAWEDDYVLGGGPESNRGLPIGAYLGKDNLVAAAELRHDLKVFPGGALAVLAFVDASRGYCASCFQLIDTPVNPAIDWKVSPGAGVALRLLRNAVLTATVAHGDGATRVYVSSGWSW